MSYWLVLPSNHAQLGNSLVKMLKRNLPYLIQSVPLAFQNDSAAQAANTGWEGRASCEAFLLKNDSTDCFEHQPEGGAAVQLGNLPWVAHNLWWQYRCASLSPLWTETARQSMPVCHPRLYLPRLAPEPAVHDMYTLR